jgi:hypothetical protein
MIDKYHQDLDNTNSISDNDTDSDINYDDKLDDIL